MINRKSFFESADLTLFAGKMVRSQFDGLKGILDVWESDYAQNDDRWLAYMLATTHHETDRSFRPIREYGGPKYFTKMYDVTGARPSMARKMGNTRPGDGPLYCGRGFVQLTWKTNYAAMSEVCGVDLVAAPDRAMELPVATQVMFHGMIAGTFTGRKLSDYFDGERQDWVNARRIINGLDKANLIADYARRYYAAISYTTG